MKQYKIFTINYLPFILILTFFSSGCTLSRMARLAKKQQITVTPNPLEASNQQVDFDIKAQIPHNLYKDEQSYKLHVYYEYDQHEREDLGTLSFDFGNFIYEDGKPTIYRHFSFPYTPEKDEGRLMVQGVATNKRNDNFKILKPQQVAVGLNKTPQLTVRNNTIDYIPDNYKDDVAEGPVVLTFLFDQNKAEIRKKLSSNLEILDQYVLDDQQTQRVTIQAHQSPDELGTDIAAKRAKTLADYYRDRLHVLDYQDKKVSITTEVQESDWNLLRQKLKRSALPASDAQEVYNILDSNTTNSEKAKALQNTTAYDYLQQYIYPALRSASFKIHYNLNRKADHELYLLAKRIAEEKVAADALTEQELQYAATLTPLLAEKRKLYEAAVKTTDKWPAYYNLGTVYVEMARKEYREKVKQALLARAIHNLSFAGFRSPTAPVYYSLASAYHLRNDRLEALQYYDYAIRLGGSKELLQQIFADKAALEIEIGQYDDAIGSLRYAGDSYQTNMNLGLSYLLKENYQGAEDFYNKALQQKPGDALAHYTLALIGARTKNEQMLEQHLRKAVKTDKNLMQRAINDLEFSAYKDTPAFKDALIK